MSDLLHIVFCSYLGKNNDRKKENIVQQNRRQGCGFFFSKKLEVEFKDINDVIKERYLESDITEYEINKFITIFNAVVELNLTAENETLDSEDGVQDIILLVVTTIIKLLKSNVESLDPPFKIKAGLTKLQKLLNKKNGKNKIGQRRPNMGNRPPVNRPLAVWVLKNLEGIEKINVGK